MHLGYVSDPQPGHERFRGMLAIPYVSRSGPLALKFRCIEHDDCRAHGHAKYDGPSGQHMRLYNSGVIAETRASTILVCEGELDACLAQQVFGLPAVAAPGTTWFDHWSRCFADFERILIVADNDDKSDGSNPGLKHAKNVQSKVPQSEIVLPPKGLDLTDWINREGVESVAQSMDIMVTS